MDTRLVGIALYYPWPGSILGDDSLATGNLTRNYKYKVTG